MESNALIFLIPAASLIAAAIVVKAVIDNWTRMRLKQVEPIKSDTPNTSRHLQCYQEMNRLLANLKYALILIGLGLPPALSYFFPALPTEAVLGMMLVFAGLGFLIYFLLARSVLDQTLRNKNSDRQTNRVNHLNHN